MTGFFGKFPVLNLMNEDIQYKYRCYFEFSSPQSGAPHLRDKKESEIQDIYVISYPITSPLTTTSE